MADTETPEVAKADEDSKIEDAPNTSSTDIPGGETLADQADKEVTEEKDEGTVKTEEIIEGKKSELKLEVADATEVEEFEDIEEEYEREIEEDGEIKAVIEKHIVRVLKSENRQKVQTGEFEEEYFEEVVDENGDKTMVPKKRLVKVRKRVLSKMEKDVGEDEIDESGKPRLVRKTVDVRILKEKAAKESKESFEEVEEEYEEEEEDESGEKVKVTKTRMVKVLKEKPKKSGEAQVPTEEGEEGAERPSSEEEYEEAGSEESEGKVEEADEELKEGETEEEREQRKFKKIKDEEAVDGEEKKRKRGKWKKVEEVEKEKPVEEGEEEERKKSVEEVGDEKRESEVETRKSEDMEEEEAEEEEEEEKPTEELEEEGETVDKTLKISLSSEELRMAEERAEIEKQYETLVKLRIDKMSIKKKSFFLNNKLMQYFKKQKMEHVFTDAKEDPDMEQRYFKKLMLYYESNRLLNEEKQRINTEWENQKSLNEDLNTKVQNGWEELINHKKEVAAKLIDARTGRTVQHDKALEDLLMRQDNQWRQIADCKLSQIKLKRKIDAKKEERKMNQMGMDFNLMDYEKLSSLKEYYTDKITERDIEITEVNQKMAIMDDKLNNVRGQLRHKEDEIEQEQSKLQRLSSELNKKRANLSKVKATKHATERNTAKIKQQSGLLAYPTLLKDYETKNQEIRELTAQTERLRQNFRDGIVRIRKFRELIRRRTRGNLSLGSSSVCGTS